MIVVSNAQEHSERGMSDIVPTHVGQQAKRIACGSGKPQGLISDPLRKEQLRRGCDFQFDIQRAPIRGPFAFVLGIAVTTL
jgi:hypothetical protein